MRDVAESIGRSDVLDLIDQVTDHAGHMQNMIIIHIGLII